MEACLQTLLPARAKVYPEPVLYFQCLSKAELNLELKPFSKDRLQSSPALQTTEEIDLT